MSAPSHKTGKALQIIKATNNLEELKNSVQQKIAGAKKFDRLPVDRELTQRSAREMGGFISKETGLPLTYLSSKKKISEFSELEGNIENFIGFTQVPTGIIGPLKVAGSAAKGEFYVPLATTEGALVASYQRGTKACYLAGGATSICLIEGVQRSPLFKFKDMGDLGVFIQWALQKLPVFKKITEQSSRYAKLTDMKVNVEGNHLILTFEYHTGDAAGQNMVTFCTDAICNYINDKSPVKPVYWFVEANFSGDKKATANAFNNVRGKKVTTEIVLSQQIVNDVLKTTPQLMTDYWRSSTIGTIQAGSIGAQGHYANGLTALFLATGQDAACVAEAATGITRMEVTEDGSLYASVTLPNLIIGTVGGGTSLPTQRECLEMMDCYGEGNSRKFAEICGAVVLAGELSIAAALSAGHFAAAHKRLGRKRK